VCNWDAKAKDNRFELLEQTLEKYRGSRGKLIPALQETQAIFGYLPAEALGMVGKVLKLPASEVYGVATFYGQFHLQPRGKNIVKVCTGTACHVRGGGKVLDEVLACLGLENGELTTADLQFTLDPVACIGACGMAPVMMVNNDVYGRLEPQDVSAILARYKNSEQEEGDQGCVA